MFAGRSELIIFPRMSGPRFNPRTSHDPQSFQSAEPRIDGFVGCDQIGVTFQPQNFKPVEVLAPQRQAKIASSRHLLRGCTSHLSPIP